MDSLIDQINGSVDQTIKAIARITESLTEEDPQLIKDISRKNNLQVQGVSLLTLKNHSLLSYLENAILVVLSRLEEVRGLDVESSREEAVKNTIVQRVCLERGVKPLEKKLNYQLDKMMRAYKRMEDEMANAEKSAVDSTSKGKRSGEGSDSDPDSNSDSDSEDEDENLNYKPDVQALARKSLTMSSESKEKDSGATYKPPKIAAVAPAEASSSKRDVNNRKLQSMEEYLQENSDAPMAEASIGSTIVNHGKGGVKTAKDKEREREVQTYEESNFTRLPSTQTKKSFRQKQHELVNTFAGEDWSIFNNNRNVKDATSRKRKPTSAWDRAKKRRS